MPRAVLVAALGVLTVALDAAVNIAFPAISAAFAVPATSIQWVVLGSPVRPRDSGPGCRRRRGVRRRLRRRNGDRGGRGSPESRAAARTRRSSPRHTGPHALTPLA